MYSGPKIITDGLAFSIDSSSTRSYTGYGTGGTNNSYRNLIDLVNKGTLNLSTLSTPTSGNHYTLYGITYPEGNYSPASRDGITPGFNNISGTKLYDCSRDLNYFVFDEITNTWVSDSFFNGERINGHCYDTYDGQPSQHATFQADFDNIVNNFPNATHIVIGSHAAENNDNDAGTLSRLQSIGLPDSHIGVGRPEYILVGKIDKPDLQYYVRENVSSAVAHLNLTLPLEGDQGYLTFDGTNDYVKIPLGESSKFYVNTFTWELVVKFNGNNGTYQGLIWSEGAVATPESGYQFLLALYNYSYFHYRIYNTSTGWTNTNVNINFTPSEYNHIVWQFNNGTTRIYINGELLHTDTSRGAYSGGSNASTYIGCRNDLAYDFNGEIGVIKFHNKTLSATEVKQNYSAYKNRFNI